MTWKYYFLAVLTVLISSCSDNEQTKIETVILGHAGEGFSSVTNPYPNNTLKSIEHAFADGADGVEVDVQLSKDSVLILFHDDKLESSTDGFGRIQDYSWNELSELKYNNQSSSLDKKLNIARLEQILELQKIYPAARTLSLNIKVQDEYPNPRYNQILIQTINAVVSANNQVEFFIESNSREQLLILKSSAVSAKLFLVEDYTAEALQFLIQNGIDGLSAKYTSISHTQRNEIALNKLILMTYGIKIRKDIKESLQILPDIVQTDNVPLTIDIYGN